MRYPTGFGSEFFFRVGVPGFVGAVLGYPIISSALEAAGVGQEPIFQLVLSALVIGLLVNELTLQIYFLYEGIWQPWVLRPLFFISHWLEGRKLKRRLRKVRGATGQVGELGTQGLIDFPLFGTRDWKALRPTALGNIIAAYEEYLETRYDIDTYTYWHHLLLAAGEQPARKLDRLNARGEGLVLGSFVAICFGVVYGAVFAGLGIGQAVQIEIGAAPVSAWTALALSGIAVLGAYVLYRLSFASHREYGRVLTAVFDRGVADLAAGLSGAIELAQASGMVGGDLAAFLKYREFLDKGSGPEEAGPLTLPTP